MAIMYVCMEICTLTKILCYIFVMSKILLVISAVCLLSALSQTPPTLPDQFQLWFNETAKLVTSGTTTGKIFYDLPKNRQVVQRADGSHDRYCGSVFKLTKTPCNHIIVDNKRFLDFPDKKYCCFCCDSAHGCGILSPDWLSKAGAKYMGTQKLDSQSYLKWDIKGVQDNLQYHKNDTLNTPRRLYQVPDDLMDFTNYRVGPIDEKIFTLPSYCNDKCGLTTICAGLRGQNLIQQ